MEEFKLDKVFDAASARQDKMELDIGEWFIQSTDSEMSGFIRYLGSKEKSSARERYRAFQVDNYVSDISTKKLAILRPKSGRGYLENAPLFTGHLVIKKTASSNTVDSYKLTLKLKINPTRFCAYQSVPIHKKVNGNTERSLLSTSNLFATQDRISHANERTLDGKDNLFLKPVSKLNGSDLLWAQNIKRYITSIIDYLNAEINTYSSGYFLLWGHDYYFSLKTIETYWDMRCSNPVGKIKALEDNFLTMGNNASVSYYTDAGKIIEGSSLALVAEFRSKERLKLYAKTNKRIRLEVEYKYNQNASLAEGGTYTTRSLDNLISMIYFASSQSAKLANTFFTSLHEYSKYPNIPQESALTFIQLLYRKIGDIKLAEETLVLLTPSGGLSTSNLNPDLRKALKPLVSAGLIVREGRPINRYLVAPRFMSAVQEIK